MATSLRRVQSSTLSGSVTLAQFEAYLGSFHGDARGISACLQKPHCVSAWLLPVVAREKPELTPPYQGSSPVPVRQSVCPIYTSPKYRSLSASWLLPFGNMLKPYLAVLWSTKQRHRQRKCFIIGAVKVMFQLMESRWQLSDSHTISKFSSWGLWHRRCWKQWFRDQSIKSF